MKGISAIVACVAIGIGLTACVRFQPKPLSGADTAAAFDARTLDNPDLKKFLEENLHDELSTWPPRTWDFPTLTEVAFYYHPSLAVARAQWGVAQAGIKTARGRPNPTVGVVPTYNFNHINAAPGLSPWLPALTFDLPIETAGKRSYRVAQARYLAEVARWNIVTTAWQVRSNLRGSLLEFAAAARRQELLAGQQTIQEQILQRLEQRRAAGAIAASELTSAHILLDKTRMDLADAQRQRAAARVRVADSLGVPVGALNGVEWSFDLAAASARAADLSQPEVRRQALQGRTDILALLDEYAASQTALQLEIARQYPDLHLGSGYQWNQGDNVWDLSVSAELPVLNRNQGPIAEAEARRSETAARFAALQAQVIAAIDAAVSAYHVTQEQVAAANALLANEQKQLAAVRAQAAAGAGDPLDLLSARLELSSSELIHADALAKAQQALGQLEDAVQQPLEGAFEPSQVISRDRELTHSSPIAAGTKRSRTAPVPRLKKENHP